ncbi:hypothetical protein [Paracraurococcus ruber]|uniref:Lipoprotein n=1 Tax=Paracraurococcus ruber TaxID=77675 RepID=A0ABS1CSC2_9PROT|nr:hypothetical protein [Paracraurococcus ruber]MBK1657360.1 hypothetical protein [Paracraurococcus ruber]TDG34028.1 hypothetical protein E2C05_01960 [Paracraurococcus ruber]
MRVPALLCLLLPIAACTVERQVAPPAYSQASPYAAQRTIVPAPGSYCEEAVGEAADAANRAAYTGSPRDAGRANRTARYAARDCR